MIELGRTVLRCLATLSRGKAMACLVLLSGSGALDQATGDSVCSKLLGEKVGKCLSGSFSADESYYGSAMHCLVGDLGGKLGFGFAFREDGAVACAGQQEFFSIKHRSVGEKSHTSGGLTLPDCFHLANEKYEKPRTDVALTELPVRLECFAVGAYRIGRQKIYRHSLIGYGFCGVPIYLSPDFILPKDAWRGGHGNGTAFYWPDKRAVFVSAQWWRDKVDPFDRNSLFSRMVAHECGHFLLGQFGGRSENLANCVADAWQDGREFIEECHTAGALVHAVKEVSFGACEEQLRVAFDECDAALYQQEPLSATDAFLCVIDTMKFGGGKYYGRDFTYDSQRGFNCTYELD